MYDCTNIGSPAYLDAGGFGGIAYALHVEHPNPQHFHTYTDQRLAGVHHGGWGMREAPLAVSSSFIYSKVGVLI